VNTRGLTDQLITVSGLIIKLTVMDHTYGKMAENTMVNGHKMICKDSEYTFTRMVSVMMVNTSLIKRRDMEFTTGLTEDDMKDGGTRANNMV
jgi:hypothetical protein